MAIFEFLGIPGFVTLIVVGLFLWSWSGQLPKGHDDYDGPTRGHTLIKGLLSLFVIGFLIWWGLL